MKNKYPKWSSCSGKKKYDTINIANSAGLSQMYNSNFTIQLYIYECEHCKKYHLTSQLTEFKVY